MSVPKSTLTALACATALWCTAAQTLSQAPKQPEAARVQSAAPQGLTTEELIGQLQFESGEGTGTGTSAWYSAFLPVDAEPVFRGGIFGSAPPARSSVMTEIVRRGVNAVPALLDHLTDARPTRVTVGGGILSGWFSAEYDPRRRVVGQPWPRIDRRPAAEILKNQFERYTVKVGDLCYVALGQIVNRRLLAVRYQPSMCFVVNSPVRTPQIAAAARRDWAGLTSAQHQRSLAGDILAASPFDYDMGGIARLVYYYPRTGRPIAGRLLGRPLFDNGLAYRLLTEQLVPASPDRWRTVLREFRATNGDTALRGVVFELVCASTFPADQMTPERQRVKRVADSALAQFFPHVDPQCPPIINAVDCTRQEGVVRALAPFHWPGLDKAIWQVYQRAMRLAPSDVGQSIDRDDLAAACAERLAGGEHDKLFRSYFTRRLRALHRQLDNARKVWSTPAAGDGASEAAIRERIESYGDLLTKLRPQHAASGS